MAAGCTHLDTIHEVTPSSWGCEECLGMGRLGYGRIWTGSIGDPFQPCALRWAASQAVGGGIGTAIGVLPVGLRTPADLALSAAALNGVTGGRFILGLGAGSTYDPVYRRT